jgi:hypothetical protein
VLLRDLGRVGWAAWAVLVWLAAMIVVPSVEAVGEDPVLTNAIDMWTRCFGWGTSVYLCFLWLWVNKVVHRVGQAMVAHIDQKQLLSQRDDAGRALLQLLTQMSSVSGYWAVNHSVRFVTSTVNATAFLVLYTLRGYTEVSDVLHCILCTHCKQPDQCTCVVILQGYWFNLLWAAVLYVMVWLTAAAPGYVSDALFNSLQRRLAIISTAGSIEFDSLDGSTRAQFDSAGVAGSASVSHQPRGSQQQQLGDMADMAAVQQHVVVGGAQGVPAGVVHSTGGGVSSLLVLRTEAALLMQRTSCLRSAMGMHFMGVPMSMQKAVSVGTALCYLIGAVVDTHRV